MKFIKNLLRLLIIYGLVLSIYIGLTLYLRPDIKIKDFWYNFSYWIVPAILLYIVLNFRRVFYGIVNKVIVLFVLIFGANHFFPEFTNSFKPYIGDILPDSNSVKKSANEILTPKNGMQPKYQFETDNKNLNKDKKSVNKNTESVIIDEPKEAETKVESIETISNNSNKNNGQSAIIEDIKELPSKAMESFPKEAKDKLNEAGVDIENPINTLENIQNKKKDIKDSFFR